MVIVLRDELVQDDQREILPRSVASWTTSTRVSSTSLPRCGTGRF